MSLTTKEFKILTKSIAHANVINLMGRMYLPLDVVIDFINDYCDDVQAEVETTDNGYRLIWKERVES